jgi:hypothetical protein
VPKIDMFVSVIPPVPPIWGLDESSAYVTSGYKDMLIQKNLQAYVSVIRRILVGLADAQVAIYLPDGDAGDSIIPEILKHAVGWEFFEFKHSVRLLTKFVSCKRSILFIRLFRSEAINILASDLIIVRPDWVNSQRYSQIVGRLLRLTNHNPTVKTTVIVPSGVPELRARFYEALRLSAREGHEFDCSRYRAAELLKADMVLRALGGSMEAANPAEVLAAMGVGLEEPDYALTLYKAWGEHGSKTMPEDKIKYLLAIKPGTLSPEMPEWLDELCG